MTTARHAETQAPPRGTAAPENVIEDAIEEATEDEDAATIAIPRGEARHAPGPHRPHHPRTGFTCLSLPLFLLAFFGVASGVGILLAIPSAPLLLVVALCIVPPNPYWLPTRTPLLLFGSARRRAQRRAWERRAYAARRTAANEATAAFERELLAIRARQPPPGEAPQAHHGDLPGEERELSAGREAQGIEALTLLRAIATDRFVGSPAEPLH